MKQGHRLPDLVHNYRRQTSKFKPQRKPWLWTPDPWKFFRLRDFHAEFLTPWGHFGTFIQTNMDLSARCVSVSNMQILCLIYRTLFVLPMALAKNWQKKIGKTGAYSRVHEQLRDWYDTNCYVISLMWYELLRDLIVMSHLINQRYQLINSSLFACFIVNKV